MIDLLMKNTAIDQCVWKYLLTWAWQTERPCAKKEKKMKAIINELFFDKQLVNTVKTEKPNTDLLYNLLMSGRITMKEYLHLNQ